MILKKTTIMAFAIMAFGLGAQSRKAQMGKLVTENFKFADQQFKYLMKGLPDDKVPQTYDAKSGKVVNYERTWWCTGFYPGSLLYVYEETKDPVMLKEAERVLKIIEPNQTFTGNHDLGFMMYCSFGNAYRITKILNTKKLSLILQRHYLPDTDLLSMQSSPGIKMQDSTVRLLSIT